MSGSSGVGQLLKGIIMGIVLILAIIGSMSMLEKNKVDDNSPNKAQTASTIASDEVKAPEINITSQAPSTTETAETTEAKTEISEPTTQKPDSFQPILEGEKQAEAIKYGILKLSAINPENKENLMVNYVVFDNKNTKVAESNNTSSASYRLPAGTYSVVSTLVNSNDTTRGTLPVKSTKTITISAHKLSDAIFELEPATTIGVLQVSAISAKTNQAMKANFIIQKENGETVASRQNVTNSLFKLKSGSYKVTVKSGNNSDFRTVVVEPGESADEVFKLQESFTQGKIRVRIIDIRSNKPVRANIEITTKNGKAIQALTAVSQTEIALAEGDYKVKVTDSQGESSKNITVVAGQVTNQIFRIDTPVGDTATSETVQISDNVKNSGVGEVNNDISNPDETENELEKPTQSILKLFARNGVDQKPINSNFYIQTPAGKHLAKKIYVNSAEFNLEPGKYKITVRAKNRKNIVRTIQISANQAITEVFSLQRDIPASATNNKQANTPIPVSAPPKSITKPTAIPNGLLNVTMQPAKRTHFIIANRKGKKIVELTSVPSGNFKLDTGVYIVTAILNGQRRKQTIQVLQGETTRLNFSANDFQTVKVAPQKGFLRSRIVDNAGRPLKGNLTVTNARGQVVARANNVTFGQFDLPAAPHTIAVNYQGLSGSERVNITTGKTTMQTFTISPNNTRSAPVEPTPTQQPRNTEKSAEEILREKLKEELRRIF